MQIRQFFGFQDFLDQSSSDMLSYTNVEIVDVTGDGVLDSCITRIHFRNGLPFVEHLVLSQGQQIFYDTLELGDGGAAMEYFGGDENGYKSLKPHSALYVAIHGFGSFVADGVSSDLHESSCFLNIYHSDEQSYWIEYLRHFKAKCIWNIAIFSPSVFIWDSRTQKFIFYWGPC